MPEFYWEVTKDDKLIWGIPAKYELQILNAEGKIIKKITKDYAPIKITEEEKEEILVEKNVESLEESGSDFTESKWFILLDKIIEQNPIIGRIIEWIFQWIFNNLLDMDY